MNAVQQEPFLRVPPFPGARPTGLVARRGVGGLAEADSVDRLIQLVRQLKVGGDYWASQPALPENSYTLVKIGDPSTRSEVLRDLSSEEVVWWIDAAPTGSVQDDRLHVVSGQLDPWHLLQAAGRVVVDAADELALIAAIAEVPLTCVGDGAFASLGKGKPSSALAEVFRDHALEGFSYRDPFTGQTSSAEATIRLCGYWRQLIDSNRDVAGAVGFAFWKRQTVAPLLWNGSGEVNFAMRSVEKGSPDKVAVWKARAPARILAGLEQEDATLIEVEDGFIRSAGLGADCIPPLSIVVDRLGVHFDPGKPSDLENLIQNGPFDASLLERAHKLRELIVASGVSKYGAGPASAGMRAAGRRYILVPGQVEDDRAVLCGSGGIQGNLDLLRRVRRDAPDAYILYKPHPDIEAGHRVGTIAEDQCMEVADEIVRDRPISGLIDLVDEVHVNTSLAGFEALLRLKPVTTHGVPFYAGWGLTRDLGEVPRRRRAKRTIDELVAAVLLLYPRYLDPATGLPCPPEILVRRIAENVGRHRDGVVVQMRRLQGRWKKRLAGLGLAR